MRTEPSFSADSDNNLLDEIDHSDGDSSSSSGAGPQLLSDYRQRYGLSTDPFVDDPHFPFYSGAQRRQILEQVLHLCRFSQSVLLVTGSYSVGKTRMAQALIDALDDADDICFVEGQINSDFGSVLEEVFAQFELSGQQEFVEFCKKDSEQDGLVVLIIDNAHHLTDDVIAQLFNVLQENPASRLHLVLFAEPHLLERLENVNAPELVLTDFLLDKFSLAEAVDYLNFRMEMADYLGPEIFAENKVETWWRQSQGQLLTLHEYAQEKLLASVSAAPKRFVSARSGQLIPHIVATSLLVGGLLLGYLYLGGDSSKDAEKVVTAPVPVEPSSASQNISAQSSTIATKSLSSASAALNDRTSIGLAQSNEALPATFTNESAPAQPKPEALVKQSVVPLAQTDSLQHELPKPKLNAASTAKTVQNAAVATNDSTETSSKAKTASVAANQVKSTQSFSEQEKIILGWEPSRFTLQLMGLSNEKAARDFLAAQPNRAELLLFKSKRQGKDWFVVVTGHYASSAKAKQAVQSLTEEQKKASPWPREVKIIQQEIRQR